MANENIPTSTPQRKRTRCRLPAAERLLLHSEKMANGCWDWKRETHLGYGREYYMGRRWRAHRLSYETFVGPIPDGLVLDHLCRNRGCINPDHLEPVTGRENTLRGEGSSAVLAKRTHCNYGHEYTVENTRVTRKGRACRQCGRERNWENLRKKMGALKAQETQSP